MNGDRAAAAEISAYLFGSGEDECPACCGTGERIAHDDECYDTGRCVCAAPRVQCECQDGAACREENE